MEKDPRLFLSHILDSIALIERYARGKTRDDFYRSVDLQDKVMRRIGIVGEAVRNIPDAIKKHHPEIPWTQIAGMRDKLIHDYFGVDLPLTWEVVERDIPLLKAQIQQILDSLS